MIWKSLLGKIEKIRQKPENVRIRYVWMMTFISLIFVLIIWFWSFSFSSLINSGKTTDKNKENVQNVTGIINDSLRKAQEEGQKIQNNTQQNLSDSDGQPLES